MYNVRVAERLDTIKTVPFVCGPLRPFRLRIDNGPISTSSSLVGDATRIVNLAPDSLEHLFAMYDNLFWCLNTQPYSPSSDVKNR
jgi:hypothetical protein